MVFDFFESLLGGIVEEGIVEPVKGFILDKIEGALRNRKICKSFNEIINDHGVKDGKVGERLKTIDVWLKCDMEKRDHFSHFEKLLRKLTHRENPDEVMAKAKDKKVQKETAKDLFKIYTGYYENFNVDNFINSHSDEFEKNEWNKDGDYEKIAVSILESYIASMSEFLYNQMPEKLRFAFKLIQEPLTQTRDDVSEIKDMLLIILQQHQPIAALAEPMEIKSPFAFIKRVCPTCGYDGEYLYYDKANQTVFCSACGTFYDVEKDSGKADEIEALIKATENNIIKKMQENSDKSDNHYNMLLAKLESAATANEAHQQKSDDLEEIAKQTVRHFVMQSDKLNKLLTAENATEGIINKLSKNLADDFCKLGIKLDNISNKVSDVYTVVNKLKYQIDIKSSDIVHELKKNQNEQIEEHKKTQAELDKIKRMVMQGSGGDEIVAVIKECLESNKTKKKSTSTGTIKYFCPECCRTLKEIDIKNHKCNVRRENLREIDNKGHCFGIKWYIECSEYYKNLPTSNDLQNSIKCVKLELPDSTKAFRKEDYPKEADLYKNVPTSATIVIACIDAIDESLPDGSGSAFDQFDVIVVLTNMKDLLSEFDRMHFVGQSNKTTKIFIVAPDQIKNLSEWRE